MLPSSHSDAFRIFGIVTFIFDASILLVFNRRSVLEGPLPLRSTIATLLFMIVGALIGVGLLLLRKWAAIGFAPALVVLPTWLTVEWSRSGEMPWAFYLGILPVSAVLILPIIVLVRSWRLLSWRGKSLF
jgi:hypothetical protein